MPTNPNAIKTRFAIRFIRAMKKLKSSSSSSMREKHKRCRAVRAAATASMAAAVGPERAWSRAVLRKIKKQRLRHLHVANKTKLRRSARRNPRQNLGFRQEEDLRRLVPGGGGMEFCSLLTETAHYINCLQTQVQVMTDILHGYSS